MSSNEMSLEDFRKYWKGQQNAKTSKYKGKPTETADGQKFQSHHEANYYTRLLMMQRSGEKFTFERQVRFEININGYMVCEYVADFVVKHPDGKVEVIDTKSEATLTPIYRLKKKLMLAVHGIEIVEIFPPEKK
jgi:hypothetical protein